MERLRKLKVIITATGGAGAHGIFDSLKANGEREIEIIATDMDPDVGGLYLADKAYVVPPATSPDYIPSMLEIASKEGADALIPLSPAELLVLVKNKDKFERLGTRMLVSDKKVVELVKNRKLLYEFLRDKGLPVPDFMEVKNISEFKDAASKLGYPGKPVCFKPAFEGGGGRGFRVIQEGINRAERLLTAKLPETVITLSEALSILGEASSFSSLLVMEFLPGDEYSVDLLSKRGETLIVIPRKRQRIALGSSVVGVVERNEKVIRVASEISDEIGLEYNSNIQLKYSDDGVPKLIEINPRYSGTVPLCTAAGVNLPYLGIKMLLGEEFQITQPRWGTKMIRYWSEVYVDKDGHAYTL